MAIPKYDKIMIPALALLEKDGPRQLKDFEGPLSEEFKLTQAEVSAYYPSGNGRIFYDRISWALYRLYLAELVQKPRRAIYEINEAGKKWLETPDRIIPSIASLRRNRVPDQPDTDEGVDSSDEFTPREELVNSWNRIREAVYADIINTILSKKPRAFEHLVVQILRKMGYGEAIDNSGTVTPYTNDKGIDGIIKEDALGLGRIHIQAKRYAEENKVSREEVQKFVGALAGAQSSKGVFITTSSYASGALEYAKGVSGTVIVLIDGQQLAKYIYDFGVGMQVEQTMELKKLDHDFWDTMEDSPVNEEDTTH